MHNILKFNISTIALVFVGGVGAGQLVSDITLLYNIIYIPRIEHKYNTVKKKKEKKKRK